MSAQHDGTSRLTYSLATVPATLATDRPAHLYVVVSNSGPRDVLCQQISVVLPAGDLPKHLVPARQQVTVTAEPADQWTVDEIQDGVLLALPQDETAAFPAAEGTKVTVRPVNGEPVSPTTHGLLLRITDFRTNARAGTALLAIQETVSVDRGDTWEEHHVSLAVAKFPPAEALTADVVGDLALYEADAQGNPRSTPATLLKPDQKTVLTWTAPPDAVCDVYYGDKPPVQLTRQEKWQLPVTGITRDTHFRVRVTLKRSGETITHHLSTAVAVEEPAIDRLTVKSIKPSGPDNIDKTPYLRIEGAVVVDKACHVSGTLYGGMGTLTVGDSVVAKKDLTVGTDMNVTGAVASTGDITTDAQFRDAKGTPFRGQLS
ncbi:hypothetical protein ACFUIW_28940 [Streptomyces sp. NPDC057245]|uniref:hypothetical protein n=1 Tax=Streptomyces TaxID=1883 RepID=UPI001C1DFEBF|nr:hypothetical protein [Streptomyces sp. A108]MBU6530073.1 hypothetical protein [Streptomyces sp. A108]